MTDRDPNLPDHPWAKAILLALVDSRAGAGPRGYYDAVPALLAVLDKALAAQRNVGVDLLKRWFGFGLTVKLTARMSAESVRQVEDLLRATQEFCDRRPEPSRG